MPEPSFEKHLTTLCDQLWLQGDAAVLPGIGYRPWNLPDGYPVGVDVQQPSGLSTAMYRTDLNDACIEAYETGSTANSGRVGQVMACKAAIDYLGAHERALQARFASPVRCRAWAAVRRSGHGDKTYGVFASVSAAINAYKDASTETDNVPT